MRHTSFYSLILITLLSFSPSVFAYLDPATGSMIISAIIGIFATVYLALKTYWYKFIGFFKRGKKNDDEEAG